LCASVTAPQAPESSTPLSSANWARLQSEKTIGPTWKKAISEPDSTPTFQPSAS